MAACSFSGCMAWLMSISPIPLKSRSSWLKSMPLGSIWMLDASNAGRLDRSMFAPEIFRLLERSTLLRLADSAEESKVIAWLSFSPLIVNRLDISKPFSLLSFSSSANDLPVMTFLLGLAIWSLTICDSPASSMRWFTRLAG